MTYHKLRIAWSVAWGIVAVLLCVLWVRSYWYLESVGSGFGNASTVRGTIIVTYFDFMYAWNHARNDWYADQNKPWKWSHDGPMRRWPPIRIYRTNNGVPRSEFEYWFLIPLAALIALSPWIRWSNRFSLRTLLIASTLVAVALGLIVWTARN